MINRCLLAAFAIILLTGMQGEDTVPPRAAGLWESKSIQPEMIVGRMRFPSRIHISQTCVKETDPTPTRSAEESNMIAKMVNCGDKTTTRSGNKYIVEQSCNTSDGSYISRRIYDGDFKNKLTIQWYSIKEGIAKQDASFTERRVGNCTPER